MGIKTVDSHAKYLDLPVVFGRSKKAIFSLVTDRVWKKLNGGRRRIYPKRARKFEPSYAWRSIMQANDLVRMGSTWRIGNGNKVRIWEDGWILNNSDYLVHGPRVQLEENALVSELIDTNLKRLPQDKIIWCWEKNVVYSVRSAYHLLDDRKFCNQPSPSSIFQESLWGKIWKAPVPNVIRNFLWRLVKHILPSRARLAKKGLTLDPYFPLCYQQAEDYEHLFMSCPFSKLTWFASPLGLHAPSNVDVNSWVLQGLSNPLVEGVQIFCTSLWKIWFHRNKLIFEQQAFVPHEYEVASSASSFGAEFSPTFLREIDMNTSDVLEASQVVSPICNRICVDAGCFSNGSTGWGLIVKDHEGSVIFSACRFEEIHTSPILAEALAIRWAIRTAIDLNYNQVTIVSDALTIVKDIEGKTCPAKVELIVQDCISLCSNFMHVAVVYVKRTLNTEAHNLVQLSKHVGCRTWSMIIPNLAIVCNPHLGASS
ncbi:hypothetical protein TSUD_148190 [Trifolium subterraneum]|uniref:RNase H type-1 domain-containing protein n=1 Tax=Trifolium subterraneum TaxID=3900 RepID=A0A2Z6MDH6_TRISU|nr:hypothetical protein TSUD_148190 [Trifolium subterraneum]